MTTTAALIERPSRLHNEPDHEVELLTREVTEILACASCLAGDDRQGRAEVAERMMRYLGEAYKRDPLIANAGVNAYVFLGGCLASLVRAARKLKADPSVGGYLSFLKAQLMINARNPEAERRAWLLVRAATERACMWTGKGTAETRRELESIDRNMGPR